MKRLFKYQLIMVAALLLVMTGVRAQDYHFSQFYQTPMLVNPALTGAIPGDIRVIVNYKDQWTAFNAPYRTVGASFDAVLMKNKWEKANIGIGVTAVHDRAGDADLASTMVNLSAAAQVTLGRNHVVSAGISGGFGQRSISSEQFQWGNQYENGIYNQGLSTGEVNTNYQPFFYGDVSVGINYNFFKEASDIVETNHLKINVGAALHHINKADQQFLVATTDPLHMKITAQAGAEIGLGRMPLVALPMVFFARQGPAMEINFGFLMRYEIIEGSRVTGIKQPMSIAVGAYYRNQDAIVPAFQFKYANFGIGFTYDVNISELTAASLGQGGFEISLSYINPNPFKKIRSKRSVKFF